MKIPEQVRLTNLTKANMVSGDRIDVKKKTMILRGQLLFPH
jgi:hypothetical protein